MFVCALFAVVALGTGALLYASYVRRGMTREARYVLVAGAVVVLAALLAFVLVFRFASFPKD